MTEVPPAARLTPSPREASQPPKRVFLVDDTLLDREVAECLHGTATAHRAAEPLLGHHAGERADALAHLDTVIAESRDM